MYSERLVRDGLVALVVLLVVFVCALRLCRRGDVRIVRQESMGSVAASADSCVARINVDGPRRLRKAGLSYYHISQIMYLRSCGYAFRGVGDLLAMPYADSVLLTSIAPMLDFSSSGSSLDLSEVAYLVRRSRGAWSPVGCDSGYGGRPRPVRIPRIPLFAADSAALAEAGMSAQAWDTLAAYQRSAIIRGSMPLDSLTSISPRALAEALRERSTPRRGFAPAAESGKAYDVVELNSATLEQLEALPGVGAKTAEAILDFRRRLGGYVSVSQISGLWPITPSRFEEMRGYLTVSPGRVAKVNVNAPNDTRLRRHPYFPALIAARIAQMRLREGGRRLGRADVEKCAEGVELSEFFWDYVEY